jgi:hypothetical protein
MCHEHCEHAHSCQGPGMQPPECSDTTGCRASAQTPPSNNQLPLVTTHSHSAPSISPAATHRHTTAGGAGATCTVCCLAAKLSASAQLGARPAAVNVRLALVLHVVAACCLQKRGTQQSKAEPAFQFDVEERRAADQRVQALGPNRLESPITHVSALIAGAHATGTVPVDGADLVGGARLAAGSAGPAAVSVSLALILDTIAARRLHTAAA